MLSDLGTSAAEALGPVTQRIELLDVLRGFALLGVFVANMVAYSGWVFLDPEKAAALPAASFDPQLSQTLVALIEAKFYSCPSPNALRSDAAGQQDRLAYPRSVSRRLVGKANRRARWS